MMPLWRKREAAVIVCSCRIVDGENDIVAGEYEKLLSSFVVIVPSLEKTISLLGKTRSCCYRFVVIVSSLEKAISLVEKR